MHSDLESKAYAREDVRQRPDKAGLIYLVIFFIFALGFQFSRDRGFFAAIVGSVIATIFIGVPIWVGVRMILRHLESVLHEPNSIRNALPIYFLIIGFTVSIAYYKANRPTAYPEIPKKVARDVQVDGYYRSDGTYVSPHDRAAPGSKDYYDRIDERRSELWSQSMSAIRDRKNRVVINSWLMLFGFMAIAGVAYRMKR